MILDRYYWSSAAYRGSRGADYNEIISAVETFAPKPDLILLLDVDVDVALHRIRMSGGYLNLFEPEPSLLRARQIFLQLAEQNTNACVLDASGHLKATFEAALTALKLAALNKVGSSGDLSSERVELTLKYFGGRQSTCAYESVMLEMDALPHEAMRASR